jgi:hypothetical protein
MVGPKHVYSKHDLKVKRTIIDQLLIVIRDSAIETSVADQRERIFIKPDLSHAAAGRPNRNWAGRCRPRQAS